MAVRCATCGSFVCRGGNRDAGPEFCPMGEDFPALQDIYRDESSLEFLRISSKIEARGYGRWTRLREIGEFARMMGFCRLGIAHGPDTAWEAEKVSAHLSSHGLETVLPRFGETRDPVSQAAWFREEATELNVVAGMGIAAEAVFLRSTQTPTVVLIARDRRLRHNPAAALYTSRGYLQDALHGHWPISERPSLPEEAEILEEIAAEVEVQEIGIPPTRLEEAMSVVHRLGASHLGISFCVGFKEEAQTLTKILQINGFRVSSACCKTGATPKEEIGIRDEDKIRPGRQEMICNPVAQAELLNRAGVDFTFVLGQCVGHDAATFRHLEAPAVCLVAKDRVLAHNTVAALE